MKYSGLMPLPITVIAVNASCEIILLLWNFGSGMYGLFSVSYSINSGCCGVPIWPNMAGVFSGTGDVCIGLCIVACVFFPFFLFVLFSPLFSHVYPFGDAYKSGVCDFFSAGPVGGVVTLEVGGLITLEYGGSMPGVLACVVHWFTRGAVLIIAGAVGCVDVWCIGLFIIGMSPVFMLKISTNFSSAVV